MVMTKRKWKPKLLAGGAIPEKHIQKEILEWLKDTKILHWRQNSGCVFAGGRMVKLGESGLPDIVCVIGPRGLMVGLEVKSAKGSLRKGQKTFRDLLVANGGRYFVVRSLEQAKDVIAYTLGMEGRP